MVRIILSIFLAAPLVFPLTVMWSWEWERAMPIVDSYARWFIVVPIGGWLLYRAVTS